MDVPHVCGLSGRVKNEVRVGGEKGNKNNLPDAKHRAGKKCRFYEAEDGSQGSHNAKQEVRKKWCCQRISRMRRIELDGNLRQLPPTFSPRSLTGGESVAEHLFAMLRLNVEQTCFARALVLNGEPN